MNTSAIKYLAMVYLMVKRLPDADAIPKNESSDYYRGALKMGTLVEKILSAVIKEAQEEE